ncbi:MAG: oligopeptide/dipeptide ABC transporter ATP-binding protein, partial [Polyangiales bacterium]
ETGPVSQVFDKPKHPYTQGLLRSIPPFGTSADPTKRPRRLPTIEGVVPDLRELPVGCRFQDRCPMVIEKCKESEPELFEVGPHRRSRCFRAEEM